jgi:hypothetical protein
VAFIEKKKCKFVGDPIQNFNKLCRRFMCCMKSPLINMAEKWNCLAAVGGLPRQFSTESGAVY